MEIFLERLIEQLLEFMNHWFVGNNLEKMRNRFAWANSPFCILIVSLTELQIYSPSKPKLLYLNSILII